MHSVIDNSELTPDEWRLTRIGEIVGCRGGYGFPPEHQGQSVGEYPFYKVSDMNLPGNERYMTVSNNYVDSDTVTELRAKPFRRGSVIFPKIGGAVSTNKKRQLTTASLVDNNVMGIWVENGQRCTDDFLYFHFVTINLSELANVGTLPSITNESVASSLILLPPLPEQRRIAAVLNTIQDAIAAQEDVIAAAKEFRWSLMHRLFTVGPGREPALTKETEIGEIPAQWELATLESILRIPLRNGIYKPREAYGTGETRIIQLGDIYANKRTIDVQRLESIAVSDSEQRRYEILSDDVIINRVSKREEGVAAVAIIGNHSGRVIFESNMFRVRLDEMQVQQRFFGYFGQTEVYREQVRSKANKANQTSISQAALNSVLIPLPDKKAQFRMTEMLDAAEEKLACEDDRLYALQALFKSMLHQLMTGQIRLLSDEGLPLT